jgi:hypothetical protein
MSDALYKEGYAQFARATIKIDTLDRSWLGENRIDIIKVDIEGNETEFLEGGRNTIAAPASAGLPGTPLAVIEALSRSNLRGIGCHLGAAQAPPHFCFSGSIRICYVEAYANDA